MWTEKIRSVFRWNKEEAGPGTRVDIACYTHTGKIRAHNEDNISFDGIFLEEEHQSLDQVLRWSAQIHEHPAVALFDGMGGERAGEKASYAAAKTFTQIRDQGAWDPEKLAVLMRQLNKAVCRIKEAGRYATTGCTAAVIAFSGEQALCANLGDSPIYLFRGGSLIQLSVQHTNEALLKEQGITGRKPGLTQFLGIEEEEYQIDPQISVTETREGDLYLLCSDGLTDMCSEEEIVEILSRDEAVAACVEELTDRALKHGGRDNITVILCRVE
ncbi:MAG TPA: serine/threonine-protein phosphatase [Candidatus Dorea merdavium]|nr:serine/threonine-protein phosphatase [Candidatus Dorea merdavium]